MNIFLKMPNINTKKTYVDFTLHLYVKKDWMELSARAHGRAEFMISIEREEEISDCGQR